MKKLIIALLTAVMLFGCMSAIAEEETAGQICFEELGITVDLSEIDEKCEYYFSLDQQGVFRHDPYAALCYVTYYEMTQDALMQFIDAYNNASDDDEKDALQQILSFLSGTIGIILTSDAPDKQAMIDAVGFSFPEEEKIEVYEVGTLNEWHYYYIPLPIHDMLYIYDDPAIISEDYTEEQARADKEFVQNEVDMINSELIKQLQEGTFAEPIDPDEQLIGQVLEFESTDLDGNVVNSADLFKDNKITMVNIWGTWCGNCLGEMEELAQIHTRLQEKGCGIVGVEYEVKSLENVVDEAKEVLSSNGITYPNVLKPENHPIFSQFGSYPTTIFVDSEGKILTFPVIGAAVDEYEAVVDKLLAGENVDAITGTDAVTNNDNGYNVYVYDPDGNPVEKVIIQLCDDSLCSFQPTDTNGCASFKTDEEKVYEVHVLKAPKEFMADSKIYTTLDTYSDVTIFLERAE